MSWHLLTATARGAAHAARGRPNQDAVRTAAAGGVQAVALADGHGHEQHFRSEAGALLAVDAACTQVRRLAAGPVPELPRLVVEHWRAAVAGHLAQQPYSAEELASIADGDAGSTVPYGSTLLLAAVAPPWLLCLQLGDGDALLVRPDGSARSPVPGDALLDGRRTTSLCQPDAVDSARLGLVDLREEEVALVLLATDGYGNAQTEEHWQPQVGADLAAFAAECEPAWFAEQLPLWAQLCASGAGSGDDTSIGLLLHEGGRPWTR
ncbi:protein phosphatase 2C domain-containing protein [Streptacidiphilus monticola]|jgi:hypothetical protein|uniref:Protein phosphatase 2C domain-containing protein n=1 Tax=Streptacidiphilus monticola TaxID=2161674 RepID=A0ABW1FVD4_9ACTN